MNARRQSPRKTLTLAAIVFVLNLGGAYLLDAMGLVEGLLSPNGATLLVLLPLAFVFYGARLFLYFVVPGLLVAQLALWGLAKSPPNNTQS